MTRRKLLWTCLTVIPGFLVSVSLAAEPAAPAPPANPAPAESQALSAQQIAQLRAKIHATMAELWQQQAAAQPDPAKVAQLQKELGELRGQLQTALRQTGQNPPQAGLGLGPAWAGPGSATPPAPRGGFGPPWGTPGYGPGARGGYGRGGYGRAACPAWTPGPGPGMGWGAGGRGGGFGPGMGFGRGQGPWFVDRNQNGVCDYWEAVRSQR